MPEVLAKDDEFLFHAIELILKYLDIIDALLQFLVILLLKCVNVEDE